ncbi:hypothetical protein BB560_004291 [Smittium megazygosporum]|uniref:Uncharacterized protein n=1 Tax=Smittium megazygosporum TaxID=133381 RepID=A0A2T9Z9M7_9FUNG|nr:hypothetical protein BB560_004291 [Smittium megazygosporum]
MPESEIRMLVKGKVFGDLKLVSDYEYLMMGAEGKGTGQVPTINVVSEVSKSALESISNRDIKVEDDKIPEKDMKEGNEEKEKLVSESKTVDQLGKNDMEQTNLNSKVQKILDSGTEENRKFWKEFSELAERHFGSDADRFTSSFEAFLKDIN